MTHSFQISPERDFRAICAGDVVRAGRAVFAGNLKAERPHNLPVTLSRCTPPQRVRTVVTVRCYSLRLATVRFIGPRGDTHAAGWNLFGPYAARRFLSALLKYPQKSLGSLRVGFRRFVLSWFVPAHVEQQTMEADEACSKNQTMRFTA